MNRAKLSGAVVVAVLLGSAGTAAAEDRWVDGQGRLPGAYTTIQAAIDAAANFDTIHVLQGTYQEPGLTVPATKECLTLRAEGEAVIKGAGPSDTKGITVRGAKTTFEGFTFTDAYVGLRGMTAYDMTVRNCLFTVCTYGVFHEGTGLTLEGSIFADCSYIGLYQPWGTMIVRNCTFARMYYGVYGETSSAARVTNCAFHTLTGAGIVAYGVHHHNSVFNGGSAYNGGRITSSDPSTEVTADPLFVDPSRRLFQLLPGSPLIGAGEVVNGTTTNIGACGLASVATAQSNANDFTDFKAWTDGAGAPIASSTTLEVDAAGNLQLQAGKTGGVALSPALAIGQAGTLLRKISYRATESDDGHQRVGDPGEWAPTVHFRTASTAAGLATATWQAAVRNAELGAGLDLFLQLKVELTRTAP